MFLTLTAFLAIDSSHAAEGMWLPEQVPDQAEQLQAGGLEIEASRLSSTDGPLAAIASLGHCTAAFVGEKGLLATNAHCTRAYLQHASQTVGRDLTEEGFLAANSGEELSAGPNARVFLVEDMLDVTDRVLKRAKRRRLDDAERFRRVDRARKEITSECEQGEENRRCRVVSFDGGNAYRLVIEKELKDLRLVYVPADSVAMFGGETDNWMWPRHCGDFAFLRAYVGPDGESADYDAENVPVQAPETLPISQAGVEEGDFIWIAGFPGTTYRTRSAPEGIDAASTRYPRGIEMFSELMDILRSHARQDKDARIKLNNAMFGLSNRRKSYQGMLANFERSQFTAAKQAERAALESWILEDAARKRAYQRDVEEFHAEVEAQMSLAQTSRYMALLGWAPRMLRTSRTALRWSIEREKSSDLERKSGYQDRDRARIEAGMNSLERSYHAPADRDLAHRIFSWILELEGDQAVAPIEEWVAGKGGSMRRWRLSIPPTRCRVQRRLSLLDQSRQALESSEDPWMELAVILESWGDSQLASEEARRGAMIRLRPRYVDALKAMQGGAFYSDANGTLRLSFGEVAGYEPQEAVTYAPHTSLAGMIAKRGSGEFELNEAVLAASEGLSEDELEAIPVNFITTIDNTGGNSGSPTLNGQGELVGWVFDRNWEAVAADWVFDPALTRSIHADVRFALWLLKEVHSADGLLSELGVGPGE